jgi:hypothetical protein
MAPRVATGSRASLFTEVRGNKAFSEIRGSKWARQHPREAHETGDIGGLGATRGGGLCG